MRVRLIAAALLPLLAGAAAPIADLVVRGRLAVLHRAPGDDRVLKIELHADDGRVLLLDPAQNGRAPAGMDGARVEIAGALKPGIGGGPFLTVERLTRLP